jgi:hypothetical protein
LRNNQPLPILFILCIPVNYRFVFFVSLCLGGCLRPSATGPSYGTAVNWQVTGVASVPDAAVRISVRAPSWLPTMPVKV